MIEKPEDLDAKLKNLPITDEEAAWVRKNFYSGVIAPRIKGLPQEQRAATIDAWAPRVQGLPAGPSSFATGARIGVGSTLSGAVGQAAGLIDQADAPSFTESIGDTASNLWHGNGYGTVEGLKGVAGGMSTAIPGMLVEGAGIGAAGNLIGKGLTKAGMSAAMAAKAGAGAAIVGSGGIPGAVAPARDATERAQHIGEGMAQAAALGLLFNRAAAARSRRLGVSSSDTSAPAVEDTRTVELGDEAPATLTPEELAAARTRPGVSAEFERTGTPEDMARERVVTADPVPNALEDMGRNLGALREQAISQELRKINPPGAKPVPGALDDMTAGLADMRDRAANPRLMLPESNPIQARGVGESMQVERPSGREILSRDPGVEAPYPAYTEADHAHVVKSLAEQGRHPVASERPETRHTAQAHDLPEGSTAVEDGGVLLAKIPAQHISVDPDAYQFKAGGDARGVTSRLHGVKEWDPEAGIGNPIIVHQRADGSVYVVDGHQRVGLAHRLIAEGKDVPPLRAIVYREAQGHAQESMRRLGAMRNIQQGSGTPVDVAKVLRARDLSESEKSRLPMSSSEAIADARAIAKLGDEAFHLVTTGRVHQDAGKNAAFGAIVGREIHNPADQLEALQVLRDSPPAGREEAHDMVMSMKHDGFASSHAEQMGMFGPEVTSHSLARPIAQIMSSVRSSLAKESSALGNAIRNKGRLEAHGNKVDVAGSGGALEITKGLRHILDVNARTGGAFRDSLRDIARRMESENASERITRAQATAEALGALEREWIAVFGKPKPVKLAGASGEQPALGRTGKPVRGTRHFADLQEAADFIEANPDHDFHQTPSGVTVWPSKRVPKGARSGSVSNPVPATLDAARAGLDATKRGAGAVGRGIVRAADAAAKSRANKLLHGVLNFVDNTLHKGVRKVTGGRFAKPSEIYEWLQHAEAPGSGMPANFINKVRRAFISNFGLTPERLDAVRRWKESEATTRAGFDRLAVAVKKRTPQERAELYDMLAERGIGPRTAEAENIASRITSASQKAVEGGALSQEAHDAHAGYYLKQRYAKHENKLLGKVLNAFDNLSHGGLRGHYRRGGTHTLSGEQWAAVNHPWEIVGNDWRVARGPADVAQSGKLGKQKGNLILKNLATGDHISVPDDVANHYISDDWQFKKFRNSDMAKLEKDTEKARLNLERAKTKGLKEETIARLEDEYSTLADQLDTRGKTEPVIAHRTYTRAERHQMGLIRDAAESLQKFGAEVSQASGRGAFYKEIASNPDWAVTEAEYKAHPGSYDGWEYFDTSKAPGGEPGPGGVRKWGSLAGHWVEPTMAKQVRRVDDYRMVRAFNKYSGNNLWKAFKTILSPTFYVNQEVQNMVVLMASGGDPFELPRATRDMMQVDPHAHQGGPQTYIQRLEDMGAIKNGHMIEELGGKFDDASRFDPLTWASAVGQVFEKSGRSLGELSGFRDDVYRVAWIRSKMKEGMSLEDAAHEAEKVWYRSSDVTAPAAEYLSPISPFVKFAFHAADAYPKIALDNLGRGLALLVLFNTVSQFNDKMAGVTEEQAKARAKMLPRHLKDGPLGAHIMPLPGRDKYGHQNYIDTKNYEMFGGGPFDMGETPSHLIPPALMPGGVPGWGIGAVTGYDWFRDQKLMSDVKDEAGNPLYDNRMKFAVDSLAPGIVSYARRGIESAQGRDNIRGTHTDTPAAVAGMLGVKVRPFDAFAEQQNLQARQTKELSDATAKLNVAIKMAGQNPGDKALEAEVNRLAEFKASVMRRHMAELEAAQPAEGIDRSPVRAAPSSATMNGVNPLLPAPGPTVDAQRAAPTPLPTLGPKGQRLLERSKGVTL